MNQGRASQRTGSRGTAPWSWRIPALTTAVLVCLPIAYLVLRAWQGGSEEYVRLLLAENTFHLMGRTLALMAGVVGLTLALSLPMAWLVSWTDLRGRKMWGLLCALPLLYPSYLSALTLVAALGPRGLLQEWLGPLGIDRLPPIAYGYSGALLALSLFIYPYTYLLLLARLRQLDRAQFESSLSLGRGNWQTFRRVVLPQLRPPLLGGSLLVALYVAADFGAVSIVRYDTFTLSIYNAYRGLFDRSTAASLATVLVLLTLVLLWLDSRLVTSSQSQKVTRASGFRPVRLGRWQLPAQIFLGLSVAFSMGVPLLVLATWSSRFVGGLRDTPDLARLGAAALSSVSVSLMAALLATALAVAPVAWAVRRPDRLGRWVERVCFSGHALPGIVVALALVFFATRLARPMYQTLALLVFAYIVRFLPEAARALRSSLSSLPPELEEAGRSLGRTPQQVLLTLTLPMIRPGLMTALGLVFLTTMKELPATLILSPLGFETLATRIWSAAGEGLYAQASLPALLLVGITAPAVYFLVVRPALR